MSELLDLTIHTLSEKLGENILSIDMRDVYPFADYFVIVTARNLRHASSLADEVEDAAEKHGYDVRKREGAEGSAWILVDLHEVVIHIFTEEARSQYKLERLWGDLPVTRYDE